MTDKFTVDPGRHILRDGKPFIAISRVGDTTPTEADDITHAITKLLNRTSELLLKELSERPEDYYRNL